MGCGCFKASGAARLGSPVAAQAPAASAQHAAAAARLAPVLRASVRTTTEAELEGLLSTLADLEPIDAEGWCSEWLARSQPKAQAGLAALLRRLLEHALRPHVTAAEEVVAEEDISASFDELASACQAALTLEHGPRHDGVRVAALLLATASRAANWATARRERQAHEAEQYFVPVLDRHVRLFGHALAARIEASTSNLQRWRDHEALTGMPPLEEHMALVSASNKEVLLRLLLLSECGPPAIIVTTRGNSLLDARDQLPSRTCVLSPYFACASGTKVIRGQRVEGGEGAGPRKEFFVSAGADATRRWSLPVEVYPLDAIPAAMRVACGSSNRLSIASEPGGRADAEALRRRLLLETACGSRLRLRFVDGTEVLRLVVKVAPPEARWTLTVDACIELPDPAPALEMCEVERPVLPLFEFHRGTGQLWFSAHANDLAKNPKGEALRQRYVAFGALLPLAVANQCKLSVALPTLLFQLLLCGSYKPTLESMAAFDAELHASLKKCLKMRLVTFKGLKEIEGLSADLSREEYVERQLKATLAPEALDALREGFWRVAAEGPFRDVGSGELRQMLCGSLGSSVEDISVRQIFRVVLEDEMTDCPEFVNAFWSVVDGLSRDEKRHFMLFVTGVESPPEPGVEQLTIQLPFAAFSKEEYVSMLGMLPQAHTCSNTLELPNYYDALVETGRCVPNTPAMEAELRRVIRERLATAIYETSGYELDATDDGSFDAGEMSQVMRLRDTALSNGSSASPGFPPPLIAATHTSTSISAWSAPAQHDSSEHSSQTSRGPRLDARKSPAQEVVHQSRLSAGLDVVSVHSSNEESDDKITRTTLPMHVTSRRPSRPGLEGRPHSAMDVDRLLRNLQSFSQPANVENSPGRHQAQLPGLIAPNFDVDTFAKATHRDVDTLLQELGQCMSGRSQTSGRTVT